MTCGGCGKEMWKNFTAKAQGPRSRIARLMEDEEAKWETLKSGVSPTRGHRAPV